jgi:RNA polymerase sigma factor (sigma-70 family)
LSSLAESRWPGERIVRAAQRGDRRAITLLVSRSHPHVQRFARTLCASPQDAEDATQEALVVLYCKIGSLRAAAALASWMFQIVRHECMRKARQRILREPPTADPETSAEDATLARLELERIVGCIATLPAEQRSVLVLRDIYGLSGGETARTLGLQPAAMKSRLHRARETVRAQLRADLDAGDSSLSR